jgi:hypothetical protein
VLVKLLERADDLIDIRHDRLDGRDLVRLGLVVRVQVRPGPR